MKYLYNYKLRAVRECMCVCTFLFEGKKVLCDGFFRLFLCHIHFISVALRKKKSALRSVAPYVCSCVTIFFFHSPVYGFFFHSFSISSFSLCLAISIMHTAFSFYRSLFVYSSLALFFSPIDFAIPVGQYVATTNLSTVPLFRQFFFSFFQTCCWCCRFFSLPICLISIIVASGVFILLT